MGSAWAWFEDAWHAAVRAAGAPAGRAALAAAGALACFLLAASGACRTAEEQPLCTRGPCRGEAPVGGGCGW